MPSTIHSVARSRTRNQDGQHLSYARGEEDDAPRQTQQTLNDGTSDGEEAVESPRGPKRARINENGDNVDVKPEVKLQRKARPTMLPRDKDGYVPGSIIRVKLHNFVTYDDVEFRPGPYLNMILGPNGTGKSSIACAICLGLCFPPSLLGRATELNSFVKQGYAEGFIEIELKGLPGKNNQVIRRNLKANSKGSSFTLNGEVTTATVVKNCVRDLNVQVDNLCAFLPQDRVAEFAQMSPQDLLVRTQEAAGDENLVEWHDRLKKAGKELKTLTQSTAGEREQLNVLILRNDALQRDVEQYKQRRKIEKQIELLELLLPFKEYLESKILYDELKAKRNSLHTAVMKLAEKNKPAHDLKARLEAELKDLEKARNIRKRAAADKFSSLNTKWNENQKLEDESEALTDKLTNLKKEDKMRKERIQRHKREIHEIERQLAHPPEIEDLNDIEQDYRSNNESRSKAQRGCDEVREKTKGFVDEAEKRNVVIQRSLREIQNLDNLQHLRLDALSRWDRDCADAVRWLRENQRRFQHPVVEPAVISLSVPDQRFTAAVEASLSANQLKSFVTQSREDYILFNRLLADTPEAVGRKLRIHTWFRPYRPQELMPPPMNPQEMHNLGFAKYAIDCVECPEGLRWFLEKEINMHRTAIGLDPSAINMDRVMEAVTRPTAHGEAGNTTYIAGNVINTVSRSRYGQRKAQNSTRDVPPARNLAMPQTDFARKRELEGHIAEARTMAREAEKEVEALSEELKVAEDALKELKREKEKIETRRDAVHAAKRKLHAMTIRLENVKERLTAEERTPPLDEERAKLRRKIFDVAKKRAAIAKDLKRVIEGVVKEQREATRVGLKFYQISANKVALQRLCETRDEEYRIAREEYERVETQFGRAKQETKRKLDISRDKLSNIDDELRQTFQEKEKDRDFLGRTSEEISQDLENQKAKLELNFATNAGVIEQYENRKREIESLQEKIEVREQKQQKLQIEIQTIKEMWLPALESLISDIGEKFSAAFESVGCAGEIRLSQHEDFDKWSIDILVKFRDTEDLTLLTGTRQSGGERALSTIMYLMSLTEQARTPFSLVDEINQGMDARYERAVHNSLVDVTCKADSGQYFLITPKLLTNLKYHPRMKVLCINNGEWLPEETTGNMMRLIDHYVSVQQSRGLRAA